MEITHFIARPRKNVENGWAITLYRFLEGRPQYLGPLGWSFHMSQRDEDVLKELRPISDFTALTGDNLEEKCFSELNIYAG